MKKNLFKILASALCFTLFLSCVGCKEKEETSEQPESAVPSVEVVEGQYFSPRLGEIERGSNFIVSCIPTPSLPE